MQDNPSQRYFRDINAPLQSASSLWQPDKDAPQCSNAQCQKRFGLWIRRHHCRWCGLVFCDECTRHRVDQRPGMAHGEETLSFSDITSPDKVRVCDYCYVSLRSLQRERSISFPPSLNTSATAVSGATTVTSPLVGRRRRTLHEDVISPRFLANDDEVPLAVSKRRSAESPINVSNVTGDFVECPVCGLRLSQMSETDVEGHINECLNAGHHAHIEGTRYIAFPLAETLPGECTICLEDFAIGEMVARLNCLCVYHQHCIEDWFAHGKHCPVHYSQ